MKVARSMSIDMFDRAKRGTRCGDLSDKDEKLIVNLHVIWPPHILLRIPSSIVNEGIRVANFYMFPSASVRSFLAIDTNACADFPGEPVRLCLSSC